MLPDGWKNLKRFGAKQQNNRYEKVSGVLLGIIIDRCNAAKNEKQWWCQWNGDKGRYDCQYDGKCSCRRTDHIDFSLPIIIIINARKTGVM